MLDAWSERVAYYELESVWEGHSYWEGTDPQGPETVVFCWRINESNVYLGIR